jgi:GT2 family glycosyltransferase
VAGKKFLAKWIQSLQWIKLYLTLCNLMISVVIPNYNRSSFTLRLLDNIYNQVNVEIEVIVIDDASTDGSASLIKNSYPNATLIANTHNHGPAACRNKGILLSKYDYIFGFDNDVSIPDRTLFERALKLLECNPQASGLALRILCSDGITDDEDRWWHPFPIEDSDQILRTSYFSGTAYAFKKKQIINSGLFPELLYMHFEEVSLAWRIIDQGGEILYTPDLRVNHSAEYTPHRSKVEVFYKPRNQILLALSCLPPAQALFFLLPRLAFQLFKSFYRRHFLSFCKAVLSAFCLLPEQMRTRKKLKKETICLIFPATTLNSLIKRVRSVILTKA